MATIKLNVPQKMSDYLAEQSDQQGFQSIEACVLDILEKHRRQQLKKKVARMVLEGLKSPAFTMTQEHWDQLDQNIAAAGRKNGKATKNKGKGISRSG